MNAKVQKHKTTIILVGAAIILFIIISISIMAVVNIFKSEPEQRNTNIEFDLNNKDKKSLNSDKNPTLKNKVDTYTDAITEKKSSNKNISFSSIFSKSNDEDDTKLNETKTSVSENSAVTNIIEKEIAKLSAAPEPTQKTSTPKKPRKTNSPTPPQEPIQQQELSAEEKERQALLERKKRMMSQNPITSSNTITSTEINLQNEYLFFTHHTQQVSNGGLLALRLNEDLILSNDILIPRNTICYGAITFNSNRALIKIETIKFNQQIYNVDLQAYSSDGRAGVPLDIDTKKEIMNEETTETITSSASSSISSIPFGSTIGSVITSIGDVFTREKEISVSFIGNQKIYFRKSINNNKR